MSIGKGQGSDVSETMENVRDWSSYVCPDCRFVFRIPRDHDGSGVACPSCRRTLRIPASVDETPPLIGPRETSPKQVLRKRRRKKRAEPAGHSWEVEAGERGASRHENSRMLLMLIGWGGVFSLIVAGVLVFMNRGTKPVVRAEREIEVPVTTAAVAEAPVARDEASWAAEAGSLARKFLAARSIGEMLPLVRNPAVAEARMREFYPDGKIDAPGLSRFHEDSALYIHEKLVWFAVRTDTAVVRSLAFVDTPQGLRVDWESWVGWSEISWEKFLSSKPVAGHVFRVLLSPVEYYNFDYTDDSKWQSYRMISPDREHSLYCYVQKDSQANERISANVASGVVSLTVSMKFPADAKSANQVEIERIVADGWVVDDSP